MSLPEDLKAELERALPCGGLDAAVFPPPDCYCETAHCRQNLRAAILPILERLNDDAFHLSAEIERLEAKLAAAEAERDQHADFAIKMSIQLATAEDLLARRPHLAEVPVTERSTVTRLVAIPNPDSATFTMRTFHKPEFCARMGGACAI